MQLDIDYTPYENSLISQLAQALLLEVGDAEAFLEIYDKALDERLISNKRLEEIIDQVRREFSQLNLIHGPTTVYNNIKEEAGKKLIKNL